MKLLFVADAQSVHTRRWVEAFRDRGAVVEVASFRPATIDGATVHRLPTAGLGRVGYLLAIPMLRQLARALRPAVVHAHYVTSYGFLAAAAGLRPLLVTAWGSDVLLSPHESRLTRWLTRFALRRADQVTTVAEHMNAAVVALGGAPDRVRALPFGVDTALFRPPLLPRPPPPPLRIVCTRNFAPVYSVQTVVEAARLLHRRGTAIALDLVGAGPLQQALQAQVAVAELTPLTTFHGHVDHPRLAQLLAAAHVFVSPALSDGNNVSLNEAMACGGFPVATDIAANRQWIDDGDNGLLYPPGDAAALAACIERAAANAGLRDRAAAANRTIVEQRADWQANVERMAAIYDRLVKERSS